MGACDAKLAFGGKTLDFHAAVDSDEFANVTRGNAKKTRLSV